MERDTQMLASLITAVLAVGVISISMNAHAVDATNSPQQLEKCFGVVKAGRNDCDTNNGSCTPSMIDASPDDWIYLPVGICEKLVGGSTTPGISDSSKAAAEQAIINATGGTGSTGGNSPTPGSVNQGINQIDSAPIMQDDMILDGGAGLNGGANNSSGKSNTPSGNSPTPSDGPIPARPSTEMNQY